MARFLVPKIANFRFFGRSSSSSSFINMKVLVKITENSCIGTEYRTEKLGTILGSTFSIFSILGSFGTVPIRDGSATMDTFLLNKSSCIYGVNHKHLKFTSITTKPCIMLAPIAFYSPIAIAAKDEEEARKKKMSIIIERYKDKVSALPKINNAICKYEGFWYAHGFWLTGTNANFSVEAIMDLQDEFQALPTDVFLASHAKAGTTWLKALSFAISNRTKFKISNDSCATHPLLTTTPHDYVPFIETESFLNNPSYANGLMATHMSYTSLPKSIINFGCRIVYICRNPKDVFISYWHFVNKVKDEFSNPMDDVFESFCTGVYLNGPFWDHVIGYYKASLERPDNVLFLTYEDLIKDTKNEVKKLAKFMGCPFTSKEEDDGLVQGIVNLCSFEKLSEVNKVNQNSTNTKKVLSNDIHFRKGIVGDSVNYLTPEMIQIIDNITREKFDGLNIAF
ncbi:P-loop containing nucleoside triphosphate hydrolase [Artemisia annua]|uniref:Sulfotransferase n=1 Tax=Artemisia annua TaxID=35608 RepID=A0A2U1MPX3_ARTAN|nr:P-loop containing nucleoside triphosphate hydrolase [Artemisia annua]